jgi:hypothetical protein
MMVENMVAVLGVGKRSGKHSMKLGMVLVSTGSVADTRLLPQRWDCRSGHRKGRIRSGAGE